jgi:glycosyltransferase involved in cell wall biosynthesis
VASGGGRPDVLIVVNDAAPYGSQRVALSLAAEWATDRSVHVATLESPGDRDLPMPPTVVRHELERAGPRAWALLSLAWQLRRLVARERPRFVLSHMTFSNIITLLAMVGSRRRPVVVEHNLLSRNLAVQTGGRVSGWLFRHLQVKAGVVVGVSDAVVEDLHRSAGVPRDRLQRLYNPVPFRPLSTGPQPHEWLAADRSGTSVVCVGGLRHAKGQDVLIDALAILRAGGDATTRVILIGDGPDDAALRRRAVDAGVADAVAFVGYQEDVMGWVSRADALVMPSRWDSFGLVAVEAARCGVAVVASDVPGLREIVPVYAPGWLVAPERPDALAAALSELDVAHPLPAEGNTRDFDPSIVAARYLDLLERVHQGGDRE